MAKGLELSFIDKEITAWGEMALMSNKGEHMKLEGKAKMLRIIVSEDDK